MSIIESLPRGFGDYEVRIRNGFTDMAVSSVELYDEKGVAGSMTEPSRWKVWQFQTRSDIPLLVYDDLDLGRSDGFVMRTSLHRSRILNRPNREIYKLYIHTDNIAGKQEEWRPVGDDGSVERFTLAGNCLFRRTYKNPLIEAAIDAVMQLGLYVDRSAPLVDEVKRLERMIECELRAVLDLSDVSDVVRTMTTEQLVAEASV